MIKHKLRILYAPLHYILDTDNSGSEFYWVHELYKHFTSSTEIEPLFIIGGARGITDSKVINCSVFTPEKLNLSLLNVFRFYKEVLIKSNKIPKKQYQILHHVLPFRMGFTFNIFALFSSKPFVLGPIQSELSIQDIDLNIQNARGFEKYNTSVSDQFFKILVAVVNPILSFLSDKTLKKAMRIIVINEHTRQDLLKRGIKKDKISIIPPGINVDEVDYTAHREKKSDVFEVITASMLLKRKSIDMIIRSIAEVINTHTNVRLTILGDGPQMSELKSLVNKLDLDRHVVFKGFVSHSKVNNFFIKSHLFVAMSKAESWGQMYLEAMAAGLPIVTVKNIGSQSIVKNNEFGYLIEQDDYKTLARKVIYLIDHPELMVRYSEAARLEVERNYDWQKRIIPQYLKIYTDLVT